ncbi:carboxy-terminal kinesin 2-like [Liolophura sinensis]|uniref:carboxy-terminal kinesin 2-like n=1 Tax=Liolophura sinensis TaxID=3198878 RepID=UPI00315805E0
MEKMMAKREQDSQSLQGRLEEDDKRIRLLEQQNSQLSGMVAKEEELTTAISQEARTLERKLRDVEGELDSARRKYQREIDEITQESRETEESIRRKYDREIEDLNFKISSLERQKEALEGELKASREEIAGLKSAVSQYTAAQAGLRSELEATQVSLDSSVKSGKLKDEEIYQLKEMVAKQQGKLDEANQRMREHETIRRKLHNSIQELKGNIRVFCRVRPLLNEERLANEGIIQHMSFPDTDGKVLELDKLAETNPNESMAASLRRGTNKYEFSFDRVFQPASSQAMVFEEISQLVQSALDGYNVCIFAYGQTGSGKTYTMEGPNDITEESMGMIPRAVGQIFETARELEEKGWRYEFTASFLEIYNETIRDLLGNGKADVKHEIKMLASGTNDVMVSDLTMVPVKSEEKVHSLLRKASENRAVAETKCNERSSRSHSVFQLKLTGSNQLTGESSQGLLSLVDLAGSERLKESGSEGQRLKEAKCINKSLSNLGNVIMALANKENFVPYRNSKLTYLLQNSLGGNSKTLMFVNVSPKEECFHETLCSLRFATKVNQCNIGTAQKKVKC